MHFLLLCLSRRAPEFRFKPPLPLPGDWDKSLPPPLGGCRTLVLGEHNMQGATCKGLFIIEFITGGTGQGGLGGVNQKMIKVPVFSIQCSLV